MTAPALIEVPTDSMATLRAMNRMRRAGFTLRLDGNALVVSPADNLSDPQRVFIRAHRPALLALLQDAAELHAALALAGNAGLDWREECPAGTMIVCWRLVKCSTATGAWSTETDGGICESTRRRYRTRTGPRTGPGEHHPDGS